jgi:hypothetical protein
MKHIFTTIIAVAMVAGLVFAGWYLWQDDDGSDITVINQIRKVAKLQTVEITSATTLKKTKYWGKQERHTVYFAQGTVTASVDLNKMALHYDPQINLVTIKLPEAEVSNASHDKFDIVCSHGSFLVKKFTDAERTRHINQAFRKIREKAEDADIKGLATKYAEEYLTTFINALEHDVVFRNTLPVKEKPEKPNLLQRLRLKSTG